jgi:hypothetical protein
VSYAVRVLFAVKLCGENTRTAKGAEYGKGKDENELVYNRYTGHLLGAKITNHKVVKHTDKVGYKVLYHNWQSDRHNHFIEFFITDKITNFH